MNDLETSKREQAQNIQQAMQAFLAAGSRVKHLPDQPVRHMQAGHIPKQVGRPVG